MIVPKEGGSIINFVYGQTEFGKREVLKIMKNLTGCPPEHPKKSQGRRVAMEIGKKCLSPPYESVWRGEASVMGVWMEKVLNFYNRSEVGIDLRKNFQTISVLN